MPSSIRYGAFLVYPSAPKDEYGRSIKNFVLGLKQDRVRGNASSSQHVARRMKELLQGHELLDLLEGSILVPVPKSAPLTPGALWASERIARALVDAGVGRDLAALVERVHAVPASHLAAGADRAWPDQHQASVRVRLDLPMAFTGRLVLIDDVVTRGSTMLGCALALGEAYPGAEVVGFAVARTLKREQEMPSNAIQPVLGTIEWRPGWIQREP